ncbi:cell surface hyaluronidase-like [Liolophura sinensis]|uniref:cell surface hyaluronidase-like n=1 Tax=Liolophura sinensis TaxID=3198878 RepID=UPI00315814C4
MKFRLEKSVELRTIYIKDGGVLVFMDGPGEIFLSVEFIHIENQGALHIGSESCRHRGNATILFRGKSYDKDYDEECGKKGLCVAAGGILEIHGKEKLSWTFLDKTLWKGQHENTITLADDVTSWEVGDRLIISSTDNDMHHAEEFITVPCSHCSPNQVKIQGLVKYNHYGDHYKGIDMRAEVGILTRNVRTRGDMEPYCYGQNWCQYFTYDTFGGHLMFLRGFERVHLQAFEVKHMGQQANLGRYPVHFHDVGDLADTKTYYPDSAYVKDLSIHHCYNRCVTVHGTSSLTVSNVVGYDTLGHCFFLEDGNEQNNTFHHNLGLVTQASTLLPTDRNKHMCMAILGAVWPGYMPAAHECTAVSTFWIAHPNNNFIENAAGGSEEAGFWFIFHEKPTGHGPGSLPPFKALRTPMGKFSKNRVHSSNYGVYIDDGVKPSEANKYKPQEYLSRQMAEYMPHKNSDVMKPRSPAMIEKLTSYKNNFGLRARGGDIYVVDSHFADNGQSVEFSSSKSFPYDAGSHQEIAHSLIVGQSDNGHHWGGRRRRDAPFNMTKIHDHWHDRRRLETSYNMTEMSGNDTYKMLMNETDTNHIIAERADVGLTHAASRMTGVDIQEGPVIIKDCHFADFWSNNVAITFSRRTPGQMSVLNAASKLKFGHHINRFSLGPYPNSDGDQTRLVHDRDGSLLGYTDSYIVNKNNWLTRHIGCMENWDCKCVICKGKYGSLFIRANPEHYKTLKIWRHEVPEKPLSLAGVVMGTGAMQRVEYHPNIIRNKGYLLSWDWDLPHDIVVYPVAFDKGDYASIGLCIKDLHAFSVFWELEKRGCGNSTVIVKSERYLEGNSWEEMNSMTNRFFVDSETGMLFFKVTARYGRTGYDYCSEKGCERLHFTYRGSSPMQDCIWKTFTKYKWSDVPGKTVPNLTVRKSGTHPAGHDTPGQLRPHTGYPTWSQTTKATTFWSMMTPTVTFTTDEVSLPLSSWPPRITGSLWTTPLVRRVTTGTASRHSGGLKTVKPRKHPSRVKEADAQNPYMSQQTTFPWRNRGRIQNPYI